MAPTVKDTFTWSESNMLNHNLGYVSTKLAEILLKPDAKATWYHTYLRTEKVRIQKLDENFRKKFREHTHRDGEAFHAWLLARDQFHRLLSNIEVLEQQFQKHEKQSTVKSSSGSQSAPRVATVSNAKAISSSKSTTDSPNESSTDEMVDAIIAQISFLEVRARAGARDEKDIARDGCIDNLFALIKMLLSDILEQNKRIADLEEDVAKINGEVTKVKFLH